MNPEGCSCRFETIKGSNYYYMLTAVLTKCMKKYCPSLLFVWGYYKKVFCLSSGNIFTTFRDTINSDICTVSLDSTISYVTIAGMSIICIPVTYLAIWRKSSIITLNIILYFTNWFPISNWEVSCMKLIVTWIFFISLTIAIVYRVLSFRLNLFQECSLQFCISNPRVGLHLVGCR